MPGWVCFPCGFGTPAVAREFAMDSAVAARVWRAFSKTCKQAVGEIRKGKLNSTQNSVSGSE
jgi:hypothetical protein